MELPFFDAYVMAPDELPDGAPPLPDGFAGAALFGPAAKVVREEFRRWHPHLLWIHAEDLERIVGASNARFPSRAAQVIDLGLEGDALAPWLKRPAEWWPLCEPLRGTGRFVRLRLPPGPGSVAGAKHVIRRYPQTLFWLDPFRHGSDAAWQGHVRLAEHDNVVLTLCGLFPLVESGWSETEAQEALRFVVGEVGAGKLLYASGLAWEQVSAAADAGGREWLRHTDVLDADELPLVLFENAQELLATGRETSLPD